MRMPNVMDIKRIYDCLMDEESSYVFRQRLMYSLTGDTELIKEMIYRNMPEAKQIEAYGNKVCFYGAGVGGKWAVKNFLINAAFVIDKYKTGKIGDCNIISPETFFSMPDYKDYLVVITIGKAGICDEVKNMFDSKGVRNANLYLDYQRICREKQYFDVLAGKCECEKEYFVDAGGYDGDTTKLFLSYYPGGTSYIFEPVFSLYELIKDKMDELPGAELYPFGLYDENKTVYFNTAELESGSATVSETGNEQIEVRKLDDILNNRPVTFIKMDIEGSELAALRGAERIIREQVPKLAICVYHKPEDIWEIPLKILEYNSKYRFYLRHYSLDTNETVLYAIPL